ncbi:MAG: hypothetical protein NT069_12200, partial [Planctomycetota bacterium]|nr:hypothetical protein [Planctomycetota bacterium]
RLVCYYDVDRERNLLATSQKVQQALRTPRPSPIASMTGRSIVKGTEAAEIAKLAGERRAYWRKIFDQYKITHLIPRLSISSAQKREYAAFTDLLNSPQGDWRLVDLGATCAVLYRTDLDNPELKKFIKDRSIDFKEMAYRRGANPMGARDRWVRSPGFYQRYLWSERRDIPPAIQQALQFVQMAALPQWTETLQTLTLPPEYADSRAALAFLAIRKAQEGLQDDPDSYWGYLVLGEAYSLLSKWDASIAQNPSRTPYSGLRYFQAVAAFNQALTASPDNVEAHQQLASLYGQANRIDLELRHQEALFDRLNPIEDIDAEQLLTIETRIRDLTKKRDAAKEQEAKGEDQGRPPFDRAIELAQKGFVLGALEILDRVSESRAGNLSAEQLRIFLQLEAGRVEEAHENGERFAQPAQESRVPNWQEPVAFVNLPNADYPRAQTLWSGKSEEATKESLNNLLSSLVPRPAGLNGWPLATTSSTANWIFERPEVICESKLNLALIYLEEGNLASAQRELEQALAANPETANRNLIAHYLTELRGTDVDIEPYPPSQTVPGLFATDEEFANRAPIVDDLAD